MGEKSAALVEEVLKDAKNLNHKTQLVNKLDFTGEGLSAWTRAASYAINLLQENDIDYCLIKTYDVPFAFMEDVDILIENREQIIKVFGLLMKEGFLFKHVPFNDDLKLSALRADSNIEIDFYPDAKWGQLRYARHGHLSSQKRSGTRHGINAQIPSAADELYIIASHAYNHGRMNLLEVLAAARLLIDDSPDLLELIKQAKKFHLEGATALLLMHADRLLRAYGWLGIDSKTLALIAENAQRNFRSFTDKIFSLDNFPVHFPVNFLLSSSLRKVVARGLDERASRFDEFLNFLLHNQFSNAIFVRTMPEYVDQNNIQKLLKAKPRHA